MICATEKKNKTEQGLLSYSVLSASSIWSTRTAETKTAQWELKPHNVTAPPSSISHLLAVTNTAFKRLKAFINALSRAPQQLTFHTRGARDGHALLLLNTIPIQSTPVRVGRLVERVEVKACLR